MSNVELIENEGQLFVSVEHLLKYLEVKNRDAYWLNGQQAIGQVKQDLTAKLKNVNEQPD